MHQALRSRPCLLLSGGLGCGWLACLLLALGLQGAEPARRPNFLFFYTDDQRYDALGVVQQEQRDRGRFPWFRTPHLDGLATNGVRFRNAFVVNALCAPSRAVFLTGRYNHLNGVASNGRHFPTNNVTHATLLRAAGYTTAYVGKWHMDGQRERPGFDYHASYIGHGRYADPIFLVQGKEVTRKGWIDDLATDYAIEFLRTRPDQTKPFLLAVGYKSPHAPFEPPDRAKQRFAGESARTVPNLGAAVPYLGGAFRKVPAQNDRVPVNLDYFRCLSAVDDNVGRLLAALEQLGLTENTMVIYTSDNGFYLGEHGLSDKRSAYEESVRIPFLVRYPALGKSAQGRLLEEMVLNLDLAPSLLDFAGVPIPKEMQGRSWRPLLEAQPVEWRRSWFYEYFADKQENSQVPDITAVRTASAKLVKYPGHSAWNELFDLSVDRYELRNLYLEPAGAALRTEMEAEHARLVRETGYRVPEYVERPDWWGKTAGFETNPSPEIRLEFTFERDLAHRVTDTSGKNNHGSARGTTTLTKGREGKAARAFDGKGFVEVTKSPSLKVARTPWTVEVVFKATKPDGILVARGGRGHGYALWLKAGRPAFTVMVNAKNITVQADTPVTDWATVTGVITTDTQAELYVNGKLAARAPLPGYIVSEPLDSLQVGADTGSPVVEPPPPKFVGLIERVTLICGQKNIPPQ